jgi:Tol biopolymer transport system component/DNA-binding winged helix-turn-helix (wHTH) protein
MAVEVEKYRFGPYEVRARTREIYKLGTRLKLRPQPFQILQALVERAGDLVTREELRQMLWPGETFVDFERGLNTSVKELRRALSDSAGEPRYIETLPKLGYRMIVPVEAEPASCPALAAEARSGEASGPDSRRHSLPGFRGVWLYGVLTAVLASALAVSIKVEPPENSMPVPLTSFPGTAQGATWSPDGRQVAFQWTGEKHDHWDIYVLQAGTSHALRLTAEPGVNIDPAWSPDGRWIAYGHHEPHGEHVSLNLVSPLGGPIRTVLTVAGAIGRNSWLPDGQAVVIEVVPESGKPAELWAVRIDNGQHRRLTSPPAGIPGDTAPAVSPDGKVLAFCRASFWRTAELYLMDLRPDASPAGAPRRITDLGYVASPAWTADGERIVFVADGEGVGLFQVDRDGRRLKPVFGAPPSAVGPAIARRPGGYSSLVFTNVVASVTMWRYDTAAGGVPVELAPSSGNQGCPRYSADGKRLAFASDRTGYGEIWVANGDGSQPVQLTDLRHLVTETPDWSPSGGEIAFVSQDRAHRQIYVVRASGGSPAAITNENGITSADGWTHDGSAYYYTSARSGRPEVWKAPRGGGQPQQVTNGGGICGFESARGVFYYWKGESDRQATLMRRTLDGDRVAPLVPEGVGCRTAPSPNGFYFRSANTGEVYLYDEAGGRCVRVLKPDRPFGRFAVSPDRRWIMLDFGGKERSNLMIMEHFY